MRLCFSVVKDEGVENTVVYGHFGPAPAFVVVNTEKSDLSMVINRDTNHVHEKCTPMEAIGGTQVNAVVAGDTGRGCAHH